MHKLTVVACLILTSAKGAETREVRTFATTTAGLLALADWLASHEVTHVAMESTGVLATRLQHPGRLVRGHPG